MSAIGGYFSLELSSGKEYYPEMVRLNTGRNALEYILIAKNYKKIYIPFYSCKVILEPLKRNNIQIEYYSIDENFEPLFDFTTIKADECFFYTNYFAFKDKYISGILKKCKNLIVDNAQAFYSKPIHGIPTFYSARKFFGVSDGAYLSIDSTLPIVLQKDSSHARFKHLLKRLDLDAEEGYTDFVKNDNALSNLPVQEMSNLTQKMMASIDYEGVALKRQKNFLYLSKHLKTKNKKHLELNDGQVPMVYPFFSDDLRLRNKLITNRIYIGQYWKEVLNLVTKESIEYQLVENLMHLPVDQRYNEKDLDKVIEIVLSV